jgi:hypothetical protein
MSQTHLLLLNETSDFYVNNAEGEAMAISDISCKLKVNGIYELEIIH